MIKEPMFISPRTFRDYEQYKTDCARASGWNEAMAFIFADEDENVWKVGEVIVDE